MIRTANLSTDLLENYMAKAKPPIVPLEEVLDILRGSPTPLSLSSLCNELNRRNTGEPYDKHKLHQRIHSLVFYGKIKAERDTIDQRTRWYSVPDTGAVPVKAKPVPVKKAAPVPVKTDAPPAEKVPPAAPTPTIDLKWTVNAIADAVAGAIGAVLRTRIEAVVQEQLQQALDSLPAQVAQVMAEPKGTVRNDPSQAVARQAPAQRPLSKNRVTVVGLLAGQAAMIANEYRNRIVLDFIEHNHTGGMRLKSLCGTSHAVMTMSGFISHSTEDLIKSRGGNLVRVSGGMSSLRAELDKYVTEGETA